MQCRRTAILTILIGLPASLLLPLVTLPLPMFYRAVEVAGYYQMTAFLVDGFRSFTYLSLAESQAGLHLHSMLSAPLFLVGIFEAGRVLSLISAVVATAILGWIVIQFADWQVASLAVAGTWLHPLFRRLAVSWMPEMLGIALTLSVLATAIRWRATDDIRWYWFSVVLLFISVQNHAWEAAILLPVSGLAVQKRKYRAVAGYIAAAGVGILVLFWVKSLQPSATSLIETHAVVYQPSLLASTQWIFWRGFAIWNIYTAVMTLTIPIILFAIIAAMIRWVRHQDPTTGLVILWLVGGFSPLLLLPGGYPAHSYYAWGTIAPLAVAIAFAIRYIATRPRIQQIVPAAESNLPVILAILVTLAVVPAVGVQHQEMAHQSTYPIDGGHVDAEGHPLVTAGEELQSQGVSNLSAVAFVGPWGGTLNDSNDLQNWEIPGMMRVVIYSGIFFRQGAILNGPSSPQLGATVGEIDQKQCEQMVILHTETRSVSVQPCR